VLDRYIEDIRAIIDRHRATSFVIEARVSFDFRPGGQAYLEGAVRYVDGSALHFREFLDQTATSVDKLMYVYHYQTEAGQMVFRYDNATHRPPLPFVEHKHKSAGIASASAPTLELTLEEAAMAGGWL